MSDKKTIQFRKVDKKRLENAIKAADEIIKRGWPCMSQARAVKMAVADLLRAEGEYISERFPDIRWS